jgi:hypoxanthine phosphoribosyltransferase
MDRIKLHDKEFRVFIPFREIEKAVKKIASRLNEHYRTKKPPLFLSVLNGSFMFTAELLKNIDFQCEISFIKLSSYSGTASSGNVRELLGLNTDVTGREVIILEDIVDTGNTICDLTAILKQKGASEIRICTLLLKPDAYHKDIPIDYAALEIPNDFIVGYGLDYDELGRQYKDIYVLDQSVN